MERGGHFAAMEQPDALAHEIREFFRPLRQRKRIASGSDRVPVIVAADPAGHG